MELKAEMRRFIFDTNMGVDDAVALIMLLRENLRHQTFL